MTCADSIMMTVLALSLLSLSHAGACTYQLDRRILMKQATVSSLLATPLYNVSLTSQLQCQTQCLNVDNCAYFAFSNSASLCSLYAIGNTPIDVAGLLVFAYDWKSITVSYDESYALEDKSYFVISHQIKTP